MTWPTEETENGKCCLLGTALCYAVNYYTFAALAQKMDHSCDFRRRSLAQLLKSEKGKTLAAVLPKKENQNPAWCEPEDTLKLHTLCGSRWVGTLTTLKHKIKIKQLN